MPYKFAVATILSLIAFACCVLMVLGIIGIVNLQNFSIGAELGIRVLGYIAVGSLLLVAALYYKE